MPNLGFSEILLILVIALLVFGAKRLPEMGASMGKGIREFKRSLKEVESDVDSASLPPARQHMDSAPTPGGEPKKLSQ
jgi:sec-independent protein translocase protein TatA